MGPLRFETTVERKADTLPRYVVVPAELVEPWKLESTTPVEVTLSETPIGRRSLKRWGRGRDVWFFDLTEKQCASAGVDTGDLVRVELKRASDEPPAEVIELLENDPRARAAWDALTKARRRMLCDQVREAKAPATRTRRARRGLGLT